MERKQGKPKPRTLFMWKIFQQHILNCMQVGVTVLEKSWIPPIFESTPFSNASVTSKSSINWKVYMIEKLWNQIWVENSLRFFMFMFMFKKELTKVGVNFMNTGYFWLLRQGGEADSAPPPCHSKTHDPREMKFGVDIAQTFLYLVTKSRLPEMTHSHRDVVHRVSGWRQLRHAIPCRAQTVWPRRLNLSVLVAKTYVYLLTKFCFPKITRLDMTLRVLTSCDVAHQGCLGVIKSNTIFIVYAILRHHWITKIHRAKLYQCGILGPKFGGDWVKPSVLVPISKYLPQSFPKPLKIKLKFAPTFIIFFFSK